MNIRICSLIVSSFLIMGSVHADESVLNTNDVEVAEAVEAMVVTEGAKKQSKAEEAVEAAETVRIATEQREKKKVKKDPWDAFYPPPDADYDWIQLTSGEWLKGDFKVLYDYVLEFDSDEMDSQDFDLEDVQRMRTCNMKTLLIAGEENRRDTDVLRGILEIDGDTFILRRGEHVIEVPRSKVISIADGRQNERGYWSGMLSFGLTKRGGNTDTTDTTVTAGLKRRTAQSRYSVDYIANYSENDDVDTVDNQRITTYYDRFLTAKFYAQFFSVEYYRDPFSNIEHQYSGSAGAGYDVIRTSKTEWTFFSGLGYQYARFDSVEAGEKNYSESPFFTGGTRFDKEISKHLDFLYEYSFRWLNSDNGTYTHHMLTTLSFDLLSDLDLDITYVWDRIENPKADSDGSVPDQNDYQLIVSLAYEF